MVRTGGRDRERREVCDASQSAAPSGVGRVRPGSTGYRGGADSVADPVPA